MVFDKLAETFGAAGGAIFADFTKPKFLACLPVICLASYWLGGENALVAVTVALTALYLVIDYNKSKSLEALFRSATTGLMHPDGFLTVMKTYFNEARENGTKSATFLIELDDHEALVKQYGQSGADQVASKVNERILSVFRDVDAVVRTDDFRYAVCLSPVSLLDLELCIQLSGRIQAALEKAVPIDGTLVHVTACVGFCQHSRMVSRSSDMWLQAAEHALHEAQNNGPNAIRAYSAEMQKRSKTRNKLREEVSNALENGHIIPWFQPQISTDTGLVTGFEALARWNHPNRGMIPPSAFLPAIEQSGMLERLAELMMHHSFTALKAWDSAGFKVPQVGVNFAGPELSNPKLVNKIEWELDRFDLAPERLAVEVLETVVASAPDDTITRNLRGLHSLGCRIDLDDFGTGHASIASIRRFSVNRIKIDRSFVIKADRDPEQQRMISAILTMAERLEVETLAEGVETVGEHALLAQLGCNHVQGFGIGKPMPFEQTADWITTHNSKLQDAPKITGNGFS